jgi:hypothetical protein
MNNVYAIKVGVALNVINTSVRHGNVQKVTLVLYAINVLIVQTLVQVV